MLLDNYDLNGRIVAASAYAPSGQQQRAINYGSTAIEDLTQILEYFPDKLKANTLTPEQSRFVSRRCATRRRTSTASCR